MIKKLWQLLYRKSLNASTLACYPASTEIKRKFSIISFSRAKVLSKKPDSSVLMHMAIPLRNLMLKMSLSWYIFRAAIGIRKDWIFLEIYTCLCSKNMLIFSITTEIQITLVVQHMVCEYHFVSSNYHPYAVKIRGRTFHICVWYTVSSFIVEIKVEHKI